MQKEQETANVRARVFVSKQIVFEVGSLSACRIPIPLTALCGDLLDCLLAICSAKPEYLRPEDAARHITLLSELRQFVVRGYARHPAPIKVEEMPIDGLGCAIYDWIRSYLYDDDAYPLLSSYALDSARFLAAHAEGHYAVDPQPWSIKQLLDLPDGGSRALHFLDERKFKKEFTERMGTLTVIAKVPASCNVIGDKEVEVMAAGTDFVFGIKRCHLSSGVYDAQETHLFCNEADSPVFDIGREFRFQGEVLVKGRGAFRHWSPPEQEIAANLVSHPRDWGTEVNGVGMSLPARWITHVLEYDREHDDNPPKAIPVPAWQTEI
ncbi:MAG TPA: hypothetical protein VFB79_16400 [Candidatus Angelobacter sp.]|nr:hypothetical protein [Candidatus Angelobacter sp.]